MSKHELPETGYLRLPQIIGDRERGIPPVFPVSRSGWWQGVKDGRYPAPVKLGPRVTAWKVEDIRKLIERAAKGLLGITSDTSDETAACGADPPRRATEPSTACSGKSRVASSAKDGNAAAPAAPVRAKTKAPSRRQS